MHYNLSEIANCPCTAWIGIDSVYEERYHFGLCYLCDDVFCLVEIRERPIWNSTQMSNVSMLYV